MLEVMIAVAVLAIAFVTLIGAQSQSVSIATGSKFDTMASLLAQQKLTELGVQNYDELTGGTGDFGQDFPGFIWKTEVTELGESETGIKGARGMLKAVDVTVAMEQDVTLSFALRTIVCKNKIKMTATGK